MKLTRKQADLLLVTLAAIWKRLPGSSRDRKAVSEHYATIAEMFADAGHDVSELPNAKDIHSHRRPQHPRLHRNGRATRAAGRH